MERPTDRPTVGLSHPLPLPLPLRATKSLHSTSFSSKGFLLAELGKEEGDEEEEEEEAIQGLERERRGKRGG